MTEGSVDKLHGLDVKAVIEFLGRAECKYAAAQAQRLMTSGQMPDWFGVSVPVDACSLPHYYCSSVNIHYICIVRTVFCIEKGLKTQNGIRHRDSVIASVHGL